MMLPPTPTVLNAIPPESSPESESSTNLELPRVEAVRRHKCVPGETHKQPGEELLDKGSYTSHRLHHAKPLHLHITSRRVFVGPIPPDWVKTTRGKERYTQNYPHNHYSSKPVGFSAPEGVSKVRSIDGLDRPGEEEVVEQRLEDIAEEDSGKDVSNGRTSTRKVNGQGLRSEHRASMAGTSSTGMSYDTVESGTPLLERGEESAGFNGHGAIAGNSRTDERPAPNGEEEGFFAGLNRRLTLMTTPTRRSTRPQISSGLVKFNTNATVRTANGELRFQRTFNDPEPVTGTGNLRRSRTLTQAAKRDGRRHGEIIKLETMLVRVEISPTPLPDEYDENESQMVVTRLADKWREYVVVCREGYKPEVPFVLNLYKSRIIPAIERPKVSKRSHREIPLELGKTKVNIFSSLDKTLCVWFPWNSGSIVYLMRPRCGSTSVEWYTFLRTALGHDRAGSLTIAVPDLELTLRIDNPFSKLEPGKKLALLNDSHAPPHAGDHDADEHYSVLIQEGLTVATNLMKMSMSMLSGVPEWAEIVDHWKHHEKMGLAWRRYDRLEWVHGANEQRMHGSFAMEKTHDLELRPKTHYPTETKVLSDGPDGEIEKMTEPPPVEGFLIRNTNGLGKQQRLGKVFQKRLYFSTHDSLLCFTRVAKAIPPVPEHLWKPRTEEEEEEQGATGPTEGALPEVPIIFGITPYKLDKEGKEIEWLKDANVDPKVLDLKDRYAYDEAERKVNMLLATEGFIDLCKVEEVRSETKEEQQQAIRKALVGEEEAGRTFVLVLNNGLTIKLQSFNKATRNEWILRLRALTKYWKSRTHVDLATIRHTRAQNLAELNVDEEMESLLGQFARKWEVSRTIASPELYNVCGLSSCRTITRSGILYRKPRRHSTFRRCNVILAHGELMVFYNAARLSSGKEVPSVYHERHHTIDLKDCYIYSGLLTSSDLLYQNQTFDSNTPGRHALPRIYADGYTSRDEDEMTCFVVWHGRTANWTSKDEKSGKSVRRTVTKLGTMGRAEVFKARSRLERDLWVMGIAMEIERLNVGRGREVEVVPTGRK